MGQQTSLQAADLLLEVSRLIKRQMCLKKNKGKRLTHIQMHAIVAIHRNKGMTMQDLSRALSMKPSAVTPMVSGLVELGLIKREADLKDRRAIRLELTKSGTAYFQGRMDDLSKGLVKVMRVLTPSERLQLFQLLQKVVQAHE